jgi:hypothetical protein
MLDIHSIGSWHGVKVDIINQKRSQQGPGANPAIASYNASVVKIYSAVNSMPRF